jgi:hypothetical protein
MKRTAPRVTRAVEPSAESGPSPAPGYAPGTTGETQSRERRWQALEAKLRAAEFWLRDQGTVVRKEVDGRPCWVARYVVRESDRTRHRAIYLTANDPELLRRARSLIARFRREGEDLRSIGRWLALVRDAEQAARDA